MSTCRSAVPFIKAIISLTPQAQHVDCESQSEAETLPTAGAPEITSAMIDAGALALRSFDPLDWCDGYVTAEDLTEAVLRAVFFSKSLI
jgi:hypothetical protein